MRNALINRKTAETDINLSLELDGTGKRSTLRELSGKGVGPLLLLLVQGDQLFDTGLDVFKHGISQIYSTTNIAIYSVIPL